MFLGDRAKHRRGRQKPDGPAARPPFQEPELTIGWLAAEGVEVDPEDRAVHDLLVRHIGCLRGLPEVLLDAIDHRVQRLEGRAVERPRDRPGTSAMLALEFVPNVVGEGSASAARSKG